MTFENKVVLVTGSGAGIGAATVQLFAKEGANVVIVDNNEERANNTAEKCKKIGKKVLVVIGDASDKNAAEKIFEETIETFGKLDVLVNNVGIIRSERISDGTILNSFDDVIKTNLGSVVVMTTLAVPYLVKTKGCIVNMSSIASSAIRTGLQYPSYSVSKAGVDAFTKLTALELASSGVRVNAVNPGPVNTNLLHHGGINGSTSDFASLTPLGVVSEPEEVAEFILYLAGDKAKSITGSCHVIDCGIDLV